MRRDRVSEVIPASCETVFDLVHDYARRLDWDPLLRAAYLTDGATAAGKGVSSVCVGRRGLGGFAVATRYVSFDRPHVAAVELVNSPPCFGRWAASIKHQPIDAASSRITYTWSFEAKPRWLRWFLEPIMARVFRWETTKRLRALRDFLSRAR